MNKNQSKYRELPQWLSVGLPLLTLLLFPLAFISPELFQLVIEYESVRYRESGSFAILENLTVILLVPGIIAGFVVWFAYRETFSRAWIGFWVLAWAVALVYFAGEEVSWGQWFFHWQTPDWLATTNRQGETNLHNISSWLNQKPRAIIETWIILAGLILPLLRSMKNQTLTLSGWAYWVLPSSALVVSAGVFFVFRVCDWLPWSQVNQFGTSEIREYAIAVFLMLYMLSIWYRVKVRKRT